MKPEIVEKKSLAMAEIFMTHFNTTNFKTIMAYAPIQNEASPLPILNELFTQGARVVLPQVDPEKKTINPRQICSLDDLKPGVFDIPEPPVGSPIIDAVEIDMCLVPGVAFDLHGNRLGRGGGYYDRFLNKLKPDCLKVALAFEWQIVNKIHLDDWDIAVNGLLTERQCVLFNNG
jgi:5-formyltetrahydrofolate cyclo-ligase